MKETTFQELKSAVRCVDNAEKRLAMIDPKDRTEKATKDYNRRYAEREAAKEWLARVCVRYGLARL